MLFSTPTHWHALISDWPFVATIAVKSFALLLLVWLFHAVLKKLQPQWHVYLWRAAAIALLLLPAVGLIQLPVLSPAEPPPAALQATPSIAVATDAGAIADATGNPQVAAQHSQQSLSRATTTVLVEIPVADGTSKETGDTAQPPVQSFMRWQILYVLWGAGILVLLARLLGAALATRSLLRRASPCKPRIQQLAEAIAAASGIRKLPAIRETAELASPALCRVLKPVLLIPSSIAADATTDELKAVLSHELAHFKSNDLQWNLLVRFAAILYWVNPLTWRMRVAHLFACELLADAASARASGGADAYSQLLARVALAVNAKRQHSGLAMARSANVLHRIRRLPTTLSQAPIRRRWLASAFAAFVLICAATGSTLVVRAKTESPSPELASVSLESTTEQNDKVTITAPAGTNSAPVSAQQAGYMDVRIVDMQGETIVDAKLDTWYSWSGPSPVTSIAGTGNGTFRMTLKTETDMPGSLQLRASASDYVPLYAQWSPLDKDAMPLSYTFKMGRATRIGGHVVDAAGKPITEATVAVNIYQQNYVSGAAYPDVFNQTVKTDSNGVWTFDNVPESPNYYVLYLNISHPDYVSAETGYFPSGDPRTSDTSIIKRLRNEAEVTTLQRGYRIGGKITLPEGSPAVGAEVGSGPSAYDASGNWQTTTTDDQGRYHFNNVLPYYEGKSYVTAILPGYAPARLETALAEDNDQLNLQLEPGNPLYIRVVDPEGKPIKGAFMGINGWQKMQTLFGKAPTRNFANAAGEIEWLWAPEGELNCSFSKEGYMGQNLILSASSHWQVITLKPDIRVEATVVDAQSGKPIPFFSVKVYGEIDIESPSNAYWSASDTFNSTNGAFDLSLGKYSRRSQKGWRIAVSASGYMPQEHVVLIDARTPVTLHYMLELGEQLHGVVTTPDGTPVPNAEITIIAQTEDRQPQVMVQENTLQPFYPIAGKTTTALNGSFTFPPLSEDALLLILHDDGYAIGHHKKGSNEQIKLVLEPWGQVSGKLRVNPGVNPQRQRMYLSTLNGDKRGVSFGYMIFTDENGNYNFPKVAADQYLLTHMVEILDGENASYETSGPMLNVTVSAGERTTIDYDAQGVNVVGRLDWSDISADYTWEIATGMLYTEDDPAVLATLPNANTGSNSYGISIPKDGTFRIEGVLPGTYSAIFRLGDRDKRPNSPWVSITTAIVRTTITVAEGNPGEVFDAGVIKLHPPKEEDNPSLGTD